jgi:GABA(A) receptor-associated protein
MYTSTVTYLDIKQIQETFSSRVPVYITKAKNSNTIDLPDLRKNKFIVPIDLTVGQLIFIIRKQLSFPADRTIFMFVKSILPPTGMLIRELYAQYADSDGLLRLEYTSESTFGYY